MTKNKISARDEACKQLARKHRLVPSSNSLDFMNTRVACRLGAREECYVAKMENLVSQQINLLRDRI
jgi:hypothetical protein